MPSKHILDGLNTVRKTVKTQRSHTHHFVFVQIQNYLSLMLKLNILIGTMNCHLKSLNKFWFISLRVETTRNKYIIINNKYTTAYKVQFVQIKLPWINSEILQLLKQKARSLKMYRSSKTLKSLIHFVAIRNNCTIELYKVKADHFQKEIVQIASKPKTLWQTLHHWWKWDEKEWQYSDFSTRHSYHWSQKDCKLFQWIFCYIC